VVDTPSHGDTAQEDTAHRDTAQEEQEETAQEESAPYDQDPPRRKKHGFFARHLLGTVLGAIAIVVLAVLGGGWLWYSSAASGSPGQGVVVNVALGEGFSQVRASLERQGVVTSSLAFDIYLQLHGTPDVEAGQYYLHRHDSFADVVNVLNSVPNIVSIQVPPGFTVAEIAARLEAAGLEDLGSQFATLATSGKVSSPFQPAGSKNLDGLLAAGTYQVLPSDTAASLLRQMIARFGASAQALGVRPGETVNGLDAYQLVTVASIVEKEGVIQKNLAKVSRVIYNRLAAGMPLQMDSTVLYSLGQDGGTVTPADLAIKSPYNTYLNTGLTPTPICFPSTNSLEAAIRPATGSWLYFTLVSQDGTEAFSTTYAGQLANEKLARERGLP
jgi:UPF0755 protein